MTQEVNLNFTSRCPRPSLTELEIANAIANVVREAWPGLACTINIILYEEERSQHERT